MGGKEEQRDDLSHPTPSATHMGSLILARTAPNEKTSEKLDGPPLLKPWDPRLPQISIGENPPSIRPSHLPAFDARSRQSIAAREVRGGKNLHPSILSLSRTGKQRHNKWRLLVIGGSGNRGETRFDRGEVHTNPAETKRPQMEWEWGCIDQTAT